jgi:hypothetical protein
MESASTRAFGQAANEGVVSTRSARLRRLLLSDKLEFLMEAHNGLR